MRDKAFPLRRTRWSNEWIMACLVAVLALQLLPQWMTLPGRFGATLAALAAGLAVDAAASGVRHRRPVCGVSGAVTALTVCLLLPSAPAWATALLVVFALLAGKHVWGGTGRNPLNPAMLAVFAGTLLFPAPLPALRPEWLWVPFLVLSLPFLAVRPFAGLGMLAGLLLSLQARNALSPEGIAQIGLWLWVCVVITDPVTVTDKPLPGAFAGLVAGLAPLALDPALSGAGGSFLQGRLLLAPAVGVLLANLMTWAFRRYAIGKPLSLPLRFGVRQRVRPIGDPQDWIDLTGMPGAFGAERNAPEAAGVPGATPEGGSGATPEGDPDAPPDDGGLASLEEAARCINPEALLSQLERHGVFGCGGAGFPAARKIRTFLDASGTDRHLLVNAVECDPGLLHDHWLLRNRMGEIAGGMALLDSAFGFDTMTLAVHEAEGVTVPAGVRLHRVPARYPAGAERLLVKTALGRTVRPDQTPASLGVLVLNVQTVLAIWRAVRYDERADARFLTVADADGRRGVVARVRLGTGMAAVLDAVRQARPALAQSLHPARILAGGGSMQAWHADESDVTDAAVNFVGSGRVPHFKESPQCSRCGRCEQVCPAGLPVGDIVRLAAADRAEDAAALHPGRCMSCGSCSTVCLAGMNLARHMLPLRMRA